ncbi:MAG: hypothetical protein IJ035_01595 [Oscillospiraceae bacterium]|nr:hypothetical protein [Oscillospiraceae bacterium]
MAESWLMKLLVMVYPLVTFSMYFNDEGFLRVMGMFCYSVLNASMSIVYMSITMGNLKLYRVMPMRNTDIVDVITIHSLIGVVIMAIPHIVLFPIAGKLDILPYFLCMDCIFLASVSVAVVWYSKDRYAYAQPKNLNEEEKIVKKNTKRVAITAVAYMFIGGGAGFVVLLQTLSPDLSADAPWLIAISAVGLIIYTAVALGARKIKNAFIY